MVENLNIDYDETIVTFTGGLRGGASVDDVAALVNEDDDVAVMDRKHLGEFISGFGLVKRSRPFPPSIRKIDTLAFDWPESNFEVYELLDGSYVGLDREVLKAAVVFCLSEGKTSYDRDAFELYRPSGSGEQGPAPFFLVSDYTPEEFIIHRLFGSRDEFIAEFGAAACPECEEVFEDHFVDCPDCGHRPESVRNNIHLIQEEHPGVIVAIAPLIPDSDGATMNAIENGDIEPLEPLEEPDVDDDDVDEEETATVEVIESPGLRNES